MNREISTRISIYVENFNKQEAHWLYGHLSIRLFLKGLKFSNQQPHHRINKIQQWHRKATLFIIMSYMATPLFKIQRSRGHENLQINFGRPFVIINIY